MKFFEFFRLLAISACLVFLAGIGFEQCAMAEEDASPPTKTVDMSITLGLVTRHVKPSDDTNEDSDFLGLSYKKFAMARFINSYDNETWFGGIIYRTSKLNLFEDSDFYLQGNLYPGIVYGYKDHLPDIGGFTPVLIPTVGLGYKRVCLEVLYFPSPSGGVFSGALRFDLGWKETADSDN
jgi:hypothetical protein